ncbi:hypothetical protein [Arsenicicoccus piscis]|uniref:hypothetical protein n=1 Tax=Arsenicicoccus piscis TaxID=673954 RepID=UPI0024E0A07F|nr:hypothetical protein [Arsenicicoccus piscis]
MLSGAVVLLGGALVAGAGPASAAGLTVRSQLDRAVRGAIGSRTSSTGLALVDARTGATYSFNGGWTNECGSIVKVLIVAAAIRRARSRGAFLDGTQQSWARRAIVVSDNAAAHALYRYAGVLPRSARPRPRSGWVRPRALPHRAAGGAPGPAPLIR